MKQDDICVVSDIWSSTAGADILDEVLAGLDILDCSSRPEPNVVNKDSLHSKESTDFLPALANKNKVQGEKKAQS